MKRLFNGSLHVGMALLLLAALAVPVMGQNIKVTFLLNNGHASGHFEPEAFRSGPRRFE